MGTFFGYLYSFHWTCDFLMNLFPHGGQNPVFFIVLAPVFLSWELLFGWGFGVGAFKGTPCKTRTQFVVWVVGYGLCPFCWLYGV